ncbi:MAG: hypothetical protein JSV96_12925 [Candidatus Aminicenantes bacterium]|nr:MAG: hypothetical protein JSV96_12925 [Candidatus Aminicenantes bacterium]
MRKFTISIADIGISFLFDKDISKSRFDDFKNDFIKDARTDITLRVSHDGFPEKKRRRKIFDSASTWSLFTSQGKYVFQDCSFKSGSPPDKLVVLESNFQSGKIYMKDNEPYQDLFPDPLGYPLNQALMTTLLPRYGGMMFHACGIDDSGYGYLFLGNSTDGKSTIARLWFENKVPVLNDDRIIVREKDGELWMYGTPWHGDFKEFSSKGLLIRKLFFLRHGKRNSVASKEGREAVSMLLTRCFPPFWDKDGMANTIELCQLISERIPCYELNFVPNRKIIPLVRDI